MQKLGLFTIAPFFFEALGLPVHQIGDSLGADAKLDEVQRHVG
jgi:hypothetical protein